MREAARSRDGGLVWQLRFPPATRGLRDFLFLGARAQNVLVLGVRDDRVELLEEVLRSLSVEELERDELRSVARPVQCVQVGASSFNIV